jgi:hypothetical protein
MHAVLYEPRITVAASSSARDADERDPDGTQGWAAAQAACVKSRDTCHSTAASCSPALHAAAEWLDGI